MKLVNKKYLKKKVFGVFYCHISKKIGYSEPGTQQCTIHPLDAYHYSVMDEPQLS
jgi:hypothetical protein